MPAPLATTTTWTAQMAVVSVSGELDAASAPRLRAVLEQALGRRPGLLVLDLLAVSFCGSAGLSLLLETRRQAERQGCGTPIAAGPPVRHPVELLGLDEILTLHPTVEAALADLTG